MVGNLRILSLGAGVQSSTLALMIAHGEIEPVDCAIFADTGWEPKAIYTYLDYLKNLVPFPVHQVQHSNLRNDIEKGVNSTGQRYSSVFFYTANGGMGLRQCTTEYKIKPIQKKVRDLFGLGKGQRVKGHSATMLIGISLDEAQRMKPSREKWITNTYPLIDKRMTRWHCIEWLSKHGYQLPPKSSCLGCPYHSDKQWHELKQTDEWADVVYMDSVIRNQPKFNYQQFMHKSLKPIDEVIFKVDNETIDLFGNECEGMCGV